MAKSNLRRRLKRLFRSQNANTQGTITMDTLKKLKDAVAANAAQAAVARDVFNQKVKDYESQLTEAVTMLEATTEALKALVDSLSASGGPAEVA